jgi:dihydrodipicolinate synthase/N-acetylneuraminate lyase
MLMGLLETDAVRAPLLPLDSDARAAMAITLRSLGLSEAAGGRISGRTAATRAAVA